MMKSTAVLATYELTKAYGRFLALRQLTLEVRQGEVFGLLGPNGSGKTTTIRLLLGLLHATSGTATIFGLDCWRQSLQVRRLVSYLPGELRMYGSMSGLAVLRFLSDLREVPLLARTFSHASTIRRLPISNDFTFGSGLALGSSPCRLAPG